MALPYWYLKADLGRQTSDFSRRTWAARIQFKGFQAWVQPYNFGAGAASQEISRRISLSGRSFLRLQLMFSPSLKVRGRMPEVRGPISDARSPRPACSLISL